MLLHQTCYWSFVFAVLVACDRSPEARSVAAPSAVAASGSAGVASVPAPSAAKPGAPIGLFRWPEQAAAPGQAFTAGIVEHRAAPPEIALLTDVRAARHDGYDRIVFELGGGLPPGFHLEYIDRPVRRCGSGEAAPVAGDAWLEVRLSPANAHTESGSATIAERERKLELGVVKELEQTCDFEAQVSWVIGVSRPNPYRVLTLNDPLRLVVDVKH